MTPPPKWNDPLKNLGNKLRMGNFETKSTTICKLCVLLAILNANKYKFFLLYKLTFEGSPKKCFPLHLKDILYLLNKDNFSFYWHLILLSDTQIKIYFCIKILDFISKTFATMIILETYAHKRCNFGKCIYKMLKITFYYLCEKFKIFST